MMRGVVDAAVAVVGAMGSSIDAEGVAVQM